jgi:hypothetical protein
MYAILKQSIFFKATWIFEYNATHQSNLVEEFVLNWIVKREFDHMIREKSL